MKTKTLKLTEERFDNWITALRSGFFHQTRKGFFVFQGPSGFCEYCCLAVFAETSPEVEIDREAITTSLTYKGEPIGADMGVVLGGSGYSMRALTLYESLDQDVDEGSLEQYNQGAYSYGVPQRTRMSVTDFLIAANDSMKWDFNQIADWLEARRGLLIEEGASQ